MPYYKQTGRKIYYETFGNSQNPCLVLISGLGAQLIHWPEEITQGLGKKGYYIVTFDNRDVGLSSYYDHLKPLPLSQAVEIKKQQQNYCPPYTLREMADDIILLLDALRIDQAHIAGISMGGMIAQMMALEYPGRLSSLTCIATTSSDPNLPLSKPEVLRHFFSPPKNADLESYVSHSLELYRVFQDPEYRNEDEARMIYTKAYQRAYHPEGAHRQFLAIMFSEPRHEKLKSVSLTSLIIHGDDDPAFSLEHAEQLQQCLNGRLEIIKKLGHGLPQKLRSTLVELISDHCRLSC